MTACCESKRGENVRTDEKKRDENEMQTHAPPEEDLLPHTIVTRDLQGQRIRRGVVDNRTRMRALPDAQCPFHLYSQAICQKRRMHHEQIACKYYAVSSSMRLVVVCG